MDFDALAGESDEMQLRPSTMRWVQVGVGGSSKGEASGQILSSQKNMYKYKCINKYKYIYKYKCTHKYKYKHKYKY